MSEQMPASPQVASASGRKLPLSTIVLLSLLAVAVGLMAVDWLHGRLPRDRAYNLLANEMGPEEDETAKGKSKAPPPEHAIGKNFEFLSTERIHTLLNREPDASEEKPDPNHIDKIVTETYRYRGAFKSYLLVVVYEERAHVAKGGPRTMVTSFKRKTD
jgi:hypothetical protein